MTCTNCFALVQARLEKEKELKQEGNDLFRHSKGNNALITDNRNSLARLLKRRYPPPASRSSESPLARPPTTDDEGDSPLAKGEAPGAATDAEKENP